MLKLLGNNNTKSSSGKIENKVLLSSSMVENHKAVQEGKMMHKSQLELDHLKTGMVATQQEVMQVEGVLESMRRELVELMKQRLLLKRSSEENKENSGSVKDCETLETQISDIKELISDKEDLCKELSKVYETRKMAFERVLEQERLNRIIKESEFSREQQIMSGRTTTDGLSGRMTQKEPRRVQVPQNLPKFRQKGPYDEPMEFLEAFRRVMKAHEVPLSRYVKLLPYVLMLWIVSGLRNGLNNRNLIFHGKR